jgi:selenocysteine lyase/cysteine desulfurase
MDRTAEPASLAAFCRDLAGPDLAGRLRAGLIGDTALVDGPFGRHPLVYADYVASGRALRQVEHFMLEAVLPYYANSHTRASYCGEFITGLRAEARATIARLCGANEHHAVIFTGAGATAGLNRLAALFGLAQAAARGARPLVLIGPYEHHSNILPWRESGAEVAEIPEAAAGGPDLDALERRLTGAGRARLVVGSFSAASNVSGILTDVVAVTRLLKRFGALSVWDYAGAGPYLPIAMTPAPDAPIDAVVVSAHKFVGGPGASGLLLLRRDAVAVRRPTWPGGGTVRFVSSAGHDYSESLEAREEAGTPNVLGDIRAALALIVKDAIGEEPMRRRHAELTAQAFAAWSDVEGLELLGHPGAPRLPIFSFRIRKRSGAYLHQQLVTRLLSDRFGIQARGGCACAGPYSHRLLAIDEEESGRIREAILSGDEEAKPGFTRLNLSLLMTGEKVRFILEAVATLAREADGLEGFYEIDRVNAVFRPRAALAATG